MPKTWRYCESFRKNGGFFVSRFTNGAACAIISQSNAGRTARRKGTDERSRACRQGRRGFAGGRARRAKRRSRRPRRTPARPGPGGGGRSGGRLRAAQLFYGTFDALQRGDPRGAHQIRSAQRGVFLPQQPQPDREHLLARQAPAEHRRQAAPPRPAADRRDDRTKPGRRGGRARHLLVHRRHLRGRRDVRSPGRRHRA